MRINTLAVVIAAAALVASAHANKGSTPTVDANFTPGEVAAAAPADPPAPRAPWMRKDCPYDEFVGNCQWNAKVRGNGVGHSFYVVNRPLLDTHGKRVGTVQCAYYVTVEDIRKWDACHWLPRHHKGVTR